MIARGLTTNALFLALRKGPEDWARQISSDRDGVKGPNSVCTEEVFVCLKTTVSVLH